MSQQPPAPARQRTPSSSSASPVIQRAPSASPIVQRAPSPSPQVTHDFGRVRLQAAPLPWTDFEPVRDLTPTGSLSDAEWSDPSHTDVERFADVAKLAGAESTTINLAGKVPGGTLKPGLNYSSQLRSKFPDAPAGETGYLDSSDAYHNPDLPAERDGALPRIVIILGPNAFTRGKAHAVATLRHEMMHAQHANLALRWLGKWRGERTTLSFKAWLDRQKLSPIEAAVLASGIGGGTAGTELFAWTEGLVTALPFTPAVDATLLNSDATYPALVVSLRGAGQQYNQYAGNKTVSAAALDRIRTVCCNVLTQAQRDRVVDWTNLLLSPQGVSESGTKLLTAFFGDLHNFLTEVRDIAKKPCPAKRTP